MNQAIDYLTKETDLRNVETALVRFFLEKNKIKDFKNLFLLEIINYKSLEAEPIIDFLRGRFIHFGIEELEKIFELLIPLNDRKVNGAFFTPPVITNYIASELINNDSQRICDPSCGCGAFLLAAIKCFRKFGNKKIVEIIENNIYGVDFLEYCIRRCKIILVLTCLINHEDQEEIKFNICRRDSLVDDWGGIFPEVMAENGFDVVMGNPPYVRYQDLSGSVRDELFKNWETLKTGTYNLYFAFFELGMRLLNFKGRLGYITPNNYFTSLAAINLREFLQINKHVDKIIDFNHMKIFDAQTYTCITFLSKTKNGSFEYERVDNKEALRSLESIHYSSIKYDGLDKKKWRLLREVDQKNIKNVETAGVRLGDLFDIRVGIATCKDTVYFIDGGSLKNGYYKKEYAGKEYLIEAEITKTIAKISDFSNQEDLSKNNRRIIFPYFLENHKAYLIPNKKLKSLYPKCFDYLSAAKEELESRDKGKLKYEEWYAYARTQGLTFYGKKLLTPTFSKEPRFLFDDQEESLFCNGYGVFFKSNDNTLFENQLSFKALIRVLNSFVMGYYIDKTSVSIEGGYPCYQKNFIERFTIPSFDSEEMEYLETVEKQEQADKFLIQKYGLVV